MFIVFVSLLVITTGICLFALYACVTLLRLSNKLKEDYQQAHVIEYKKLVEISQSYKLLFDNYFKSVTNEKTDC